MKAAVFKGAGVPLAVEQVADPTPEDNQLVVDVAYCGICGTDLHSTREGPAMVACDSVLGHEFVGEVAATGKHMHGDWKEGDRVCALPFLSCGHCEACVTGRPFECAAIACIGLDVPGGFAEYVKTSEFNTLRLPDGLATRDAALVEPLAVGLHAVRVAGLTDRRVERDATQEGQLHLFRERLASPGAEDVDDLVAVGTGQPAHVLDDPEDPRVHALEHLHPASHVAGGDVLRRGHHDGTVEVDGLHQGELGVPRTRRHVDDHQVEGAPVHLLEELLQDPGDERATHDGRLVLKDLGVGVRRLHRIGRRHKGRL